MQELKIEPPEESTVRSIPATIALRISCVILGAIIGFSFYMGGYMNLVFLLNKSVGDEEYVIGNFSLSVLIWSILGFILPLSRIKDYLVLFFNLLRGSPDSGNLAYMGRLAGIAGVFTVLTIVHWYFIELLAEFLTALFG